MSLGYVSAAILFIGVRVYLFKVIVVYSSSTVEYVISCTAVFDSSIYGRNLVVSELGAPRSVCCTNQLDTLTAVSFYQNFSPKYDMDKQENAECMSAS